MKKYDVIIIGAGAAGLSAAYHIKKHDNSIDVLVIDRMKEAAKKILISGAGRCNISNEYLKNKPVDHYYGGNKKFINRVFSKFGFNEIKAFFKELGIGTYIDKKDERGKIFPITNHAATVRDILYEEVLLHDVKFLFNTTCNKIVKNIDGFELTTTIASKQNYYQAKKVIVATGGKSYPILGADGSGYKIVSDLGHTIINPVPVAVPLIAKNPLSQKLQNVHMTVSATAIISGVDAIKVTDEIVFTKYGFSGPAILDISRYFSLAINRNNNTDTFIKFDFIPYLTINELKEELNNRWQQSTKTIAHSLYGLFLNKFCIRFLEYINIDPDRKVNSLTSIEKEKIIDSLKKTKIKVYETKSWEVAEFTAGGVNIKEVNDSTMESKIVKGLYLIGEILDVDGEIGGYNLSWAWATGAIAGMQC